MIQNVAIAKCYSVIDYLSSDMYNAFIHTTSMVIYSGSHLLIYDQVDTWFLTFNAIDGDYVSLTRYQ